MTNNSPFLRPVKKYLAGQAIEKAWLFGSYARNDFDDKSDVNILVRFRQPNTLDLFDYIGIQQDLEDITGKKVDLVEEGFVKPFAKESIEKEKQLIYERKRFGEQKRKNFRPCEKV